MFLNCVLNRKTSNDNDNPDCDCDARERMLRFSEACDGLIKNLLVKTAFASYSLKLSLLLLLNIS